jgi:zinc protease
MIMSCEKLKHPVRYGSAVFGLMLFMAALFAPPGLYADYTADRQPRALPLCAHDKSDLAPDPAIKFGCLENGFRYVLMKNNEPKDRVSLHLDVQSGSLQEGDNEQGLAHFLEHMLFNGTAHFPPGELIKYFNSIGMELGHDANARTGFTDTVYDIMLPSGDPQTLEKALLVIQDYAQGALLLPEELDRERKVVLAEMNDRDSASYRTFESTMKFEFPEAKISRRLPIGKEKVIKTMDHALLKSFYDNHYRPDNMVLVMVGDFDISIVEQLIQKRFGAMVFRGRAQPKMDFGEIRHKGIKPFYHFEKDEGLTTVTLESLEKIYPEPDSFALQKRMLVEDVLNRIIGYRLDSLVREAGSPFTTASIRSGVLTDFVRYAEISADCDPINWEAALTVLEQVLRRAMTHGLTLDELERAKKEILSDFANDVKTASTRDSKKLAEYIIHKINMGRVIQSPFQKQEIFSPVIRDLTLKDVSDCMKNLWENDHRLVLVTGNALIQSSGKKTPEEKILSIYQKSSEQPVGPPGKKETRPFPYLKTPDHKGSVLSRVELPETGIVQIEFGNNIRLNLKKTDFKANEVTIAATFGLGRSSEPLDKPGLGMLSEALINESAFGLMDKAELERSLAGKETKFSFKTNEDCFAVNIDTVSDELKLAFQLLYAQFLDPGFGKDAFKLVKERLNQEYDGLSHSVEGVMEIHGKPFLAGGDTRFSFPRPDQFNRMTLEDIIDWVTPVLRQSPLEISVVGDFNMEDIVGIASEYVGSLPVREEKIHADAQPSPKFPMGKRLDLKADTKIPQGLVVVGYPTDDIWDIQKTRRLSILAEVFSEKLRDRIREKLGASYSPDAYNHPSRAFEGFGILYAVVQTDPSSVAEVVREIGKIAQDLCRGPISAGELENAVDPVLTRIKDQMRRNDYWLNTVLAGSKKHPEQIGWSRSIIEDYRAISREDILSMAKVYLDNTNAATIIVLPEKNEPRP